MKKKLTSLGLVVLALLALLMVGAASAGPDATAAAPGHELLPPDGASGWCDISFHSSDQQTCESTCYQTYGCGFKDWWPSNCMCFCGTTF
ncbi:MAG: hypothetical protein D6696_11835 [Acidobacteria bacterium]|nr:MAG: hypothetical protein D6696_11835 [Acidobacteriota bacterium]